jgi:hypothetical protein
MSAANRERAHKHNPRPTGTYRAEVDIAAKDGAGADATSDPVASLKHEDSIAQVLELTCSREARGTGPDDNHPLSWYICMQRIVLKVR